MYDVKYQHRIDAFERYLFPNLEGDWRELATVQPMPPDLLFPWFGKDRLTFRTNPITGSMEVVREEG